ncbi:MAG: amidohydrolase [Desulfobacteraceae bacterium]|nr:amidohydrolase [Desulfobacteraceae bacterium]
MKKHADILVENGIVITMDEDNSMITDGAVAVVGDVIEKIGGTDDFTEWDADNRIDAKGGIILPGLINTHTHAAMTLFRGLADDLPLMAWLNDHIFPAEAKLAADHVCSGAYLACAEMILSGTTCFCDMYLFEDAVAEAAHQAFIRAVVGEVLFDFPSPNYGSWENGLAYSKQLMDKWRDDRLITIAVEPHSPYLCAPALLKGAAELAHDNDAPLVIHLSETRAEVDGLLKKVKKTPVAHLADLGFLSSRLIAAHCVVLSPADIDLLKIHDVKVSHNPESNMKLASGIAPIPELLDAGVCVGLGTDGCSSNNNLDLFCEMDMAAKLHKVNRLDPTVVDARSALKMATIDAARVLGLDHMIGSLEPGKKADIIVVDTRKPHLTPMYNPVSHLVYAASGADVSHAIIDGRLVMDNRELLVIDAEKAMADVRSIVGAGQ